MRVSLWSCALIALVTGHSATQDKPDFSGQWMLVSPLDPAPNIALEMTVSQSAAQSQRITIERRFKTEARSEEYTIGLGFGTVQGVVGSAQDGHSLQTRFMVKWSGNTLVIQTGTYTRQPRESGPFTEHDETWSLDANGMLLITVADRGFGSEPKTTELAYRRRVKDGQFVISGTYFNPFDRKQYSVVTFPSVSWRVRRDGPHAAWIPSWPRSTRFCLPSASCSSPAPSQAPG